MKKTCLLSLCCILFLYATVIHADYDYSGSLQSQKDVLMFEFTVDEPGVITFFTSVWNDGNGLDLLLSVWDAVGNFLLQFDDANDTFYFGSNNTPYLIGELDVFGQDWFDTGRYVATLTIGGNWAGGTHLSGGFDYDMDTPLSIEQWSGGTTSNDVSFHIIETSNVQVLQYPPDGATVLEPGTLAILGIGLASLPFIRRRFR